jgi:hypothetical protein
MFTSILAATDRVTGRDPVIISAARMASALGASWSIVHVLASASPDNHERVLHFRTGQSGRHRPLSFGNTPPAAACLQRPVCLVNAL